jgi:broad specificity phosphatase PhoE
VLIVVRHGRTEPNAAGLLLGRRLDPALDELGRRQATALRPVLAHAARVICSPLRRARETAESLGLPVTVDERWIELDYGDFDGRPITGVPRETWDRWRSDLDFVLGGGESLRDLGQRVHAAVADLAEEARNHDVVVVSHVSPIKAAVTWAMGVGDEAVWRMYCAPASVTTISTAGALPSLHSYNVTAHLAGL